MDVRNILSETIQTGYWSHWTLLMHSTLSAELHSSSKCRTSSPLILPWVWQCYGQHSHLFIRGADTIPSACGARQGDPMGPFLFCLAIQPFLEEASAQVQSLTHMDGIYLVGAPEKMPGVISSLQKNLGSVNLNLNTNKSWATRECMRGL